MTKKAALHNLGCKVNAYETEAMEQMLREAGFEIVPFASGADVYVINTCTVTNIADRKSRQMLHRARAMNPDAIVVAAGCYVQTAHDQDRLEGLEGVDLILGNNHKNELVPAILRLMQEKKPMRNTDAVPSAADMEASVNRALNEKENGGKAQYVSDLTRACDYEQMKLDRSMSHTRTFLKVQDGCNQFCSYCVIPFARGRVRSSRPEDVEQEVRVLAENGCKELVLTGIHLSSYGVDCESSLADLILRIHAVSGIDRIRLGSLEPGIITEDFTRMLVGLDKFCPHFHLSLQSGCNATLRRMNRHYSTEEFREKCEMLRNVFDRPALTTDVIVGFPGESEDEFEQTKEFLSELKLFESHIFKYSRRRGTRADAMPDQIPEEIKARRSDILIALGEENRSRFEASWQGSRVRVLTEEEVMMDGTSWYAGYTDEYIRTMVHTSACGKANQVLTGVLGRQLNGHVFQLVID